MCKSPCNLDPPTLHGPFARLCKAPGSESHPGVPVARELGDLGSQRQAQPRRLFSSTLRQLSQAKESALAYCGAVTKKGLSLAGALGGARCSGVTRGSTPASGASWLQGCQSKSTPSSSPSLPQNDGSREGQEGDFRELRSAQAPGDPLAANVGRWRSGKAKWKADLLLQFRAGFSETAGSDGRLAETATAGTLGRQCWRSVPRYASLCSLPDPGHQAAEHLRIS